MIALGCTQLLHADKHAVMMDAALAMLRSAAVGQSAVGASNRLARLGAGRVPNECADACTPSSHTTQWVHARTTDIGMSAHVRKCHRCPARPC
jgi:hypothetical protein